MSIRRLYQLYMHGIATMIFSCSNDSYWEIWILVESNLGSLNSTLATTIMRARAMTWLHCIKNPIYWSFDISLRMECFTLRSWEPPTYCTLACMLAEHKICCFICAIYSLSIVGFFISLLPINSLSYSALMLLDRIVFPPLRPRSRHNNAIYIYSFYESSWTRWRHYTSSGSEIATRILWLWIQGINSLGEFPTRATHTVRFAAVASGICPLLFAVSGLQVTIRVWAGRPSAWAREHGVFGRKFKLKSREEECL